MQKIHILLISAIIGVFIIGFIEIYYPSVLTIDGFTDMITGDGEGSWGGNEDGRGGGSRAGHSSSPFITAFIPPAIVGDDIDSEDPDYIRDIRYFHGRADVQRIGSKQDYCRMLVPKSSADSTDQMFFACDLGGTSGMSTVSYRTQTVISGFKLSRDDYMNDLGDGRQSYCRILKMSGGGGGNGAGGGIEESDFECMCNPATDTGFRSKMTIDPSPPPAIELLMTFYEGCVFWLRLRDDTLDYAKNLVIKSAGKCFVDEHPPAPPVARGLSFNGIDQYLRIGDNTDLTFGYRVDLQYLRGFMFWVYFDKFTNNAQIFDFGNGAGKDNVRIGIIGRGNPAINGDRENGDGGVGAGGVGVGGVGAGGGGLFDSCSLIPKWPSGAQCPDLVTPQTLMETTQANVNDFICPGPTVVGRKMEPIQPQSANNSVGAGGGATADLSYEIWDHQQRKLHVQLNNAVSVGKWTHICVSALSVDPTKPDIGFYVNGREVHIERAGWLPQATFVSKNYIGRSNWTTATSPYQNADELFCGKLFDFRGYKLPIPMRKIQDSIKWGRSMLAID
jgi:hypothetical protein